MKTLFFVLFALLGVSMLNNTHAANAFNFSFKSIDGEDLPLESFKGKTVLVVNTASFCGFTKQYDGLQSLWDSYKDQGLVVLGVPSNDFGAQEPGTEGEIKKFCEVNFNIDFPMTEKVAVKGSSAHPFYKWARDELGFIAAPKWNFHKYLINGEGELVDWFSTTTDPNSTKVINRVTKHLSANATQ